MPTKLLEKLMLWVDDMALPCMDIDELLEYIEMVLTMCAHLNFKLHPAKCELYKMLINWYGRTISADGVRLDPRNVVALEEMTPPTTAPELLQFTSALQWVRTSIPNFSHRIQPLMDILEQACALTNKRTKRALARVPLHKVGWDDVAIQ